MNRRTDKTNCLTTCAYIALKTEVIITCILLTCSMTGSCVGDTYKENNPSSAPSIT